MQPVQPVGAQQFDGADADQQVLVHALAVEVVGHAGQLDLAVQRLVADAQQRAVGHAEAEAVGGNRRAFHVERHGARLREAPLRRAGAQQLPVAVVGGGHGAGAQHALQFVAGQAGDVGHGLLQGDLHLGQRGHRDPQRQVFVEHVVLAHVAVGQHVVAQLLAAAQAGAVADHDPRVRAQHGDVVGDGLGVGRADADVDEADAAAVVALEVVGRHLRQARRWRAALVAGVGAGAPRDHVARLHEGAVRAARVLHLQLAERNELVDVELVVGEQDEVLEVLGRGAGVVAQAVQRIVHPRRGEQRQRVRIAGQHAVRAVGDAVVHGRQVGQVEHVGQALALQRRHAAFEVVVVGQAEGKGNGLAAGADLQRRAMVGQQQAELLEVVVGEQAGPRQRGLVMAGVRDEAVGQARIGVAAVRGGQAHEGVARAHARGPLTRAFGLRHIGLQGAAQVGERGVVDALRLRQRGGGIGEGRGRNEGRQRDHDLLCVSGVTAVVTGGARWWV